MHWVLMVTMMLIGSVSAQGQMDRDKFKQRSHRLLNYCYYEIYNPSDKLDHSGNCVCFRDAMISALTDEQLNTITSSRAAPMSADAIAVAKRQCGM